MDYNFNLSHCIKEAHSFGYDTFYNICNGTNHVVPWGSMDYLSGITLLTVAVVLVLAVVSAITTLGFMIYEEYKEVA